MAVSCEIEATKRLGRVLRSRVVGQDDALEAVVCSFCRVLSGLRDSSRPVLTMLLLGPTGVGKTETARALAHALFGHETGLTKVNCEEYSHGHELSKLFGAPPGYIGWGLEPLLSQERIDAPHREALEKRAGMLGEGSTELDGTFSAEEGKNLSVVLFDEIEKAHPKVWNALLGILEDGKLTLGDNRTVDFTRSIILMTSNVGSRELSGLLERHKVGFRTAGEPPAPQIRELTTAARMAAEQVFPFEFLNRFDEILVYSPLQRLHLEQIFDKFLSDLHGRALKEADLPLLIRVSPKAKDRILQRGTDPRFGARPLRRAIESELVDPLSRLIASRRLLPGDVIEVEEQGDSLVFYRLLKRSETLVTF